MPAEKIRDSGRVQRIVSIAYLLSTRSEIHVEELCERLGIDREQLESDLNTLMYCGLPPYSPDQLFDISIEEDFVSMYFNDVFVKPLRLSTNEKAQVLIALARMQTTDEGEKLAIKRVAQAIDQNADAVSVENVSNAFDKIIQEAINTKTNLTMKYLSLTSASIKDREVIPLEVFTTASVAYLYGIDLSVNAKRIFRTDRILEASLSESSDTDVSQYENIDYSDGQFFIDTSDNYVDLSIRKDASWILDTYPHEKTKTKGVYRFYSPTAFFAARLLIANPEYVDYYDGIIPVNDIVDAIKAIKLRSNKTKEGISDDA